MICSFPVSYISHVVVGKGVCGLCFVGWIMHPNMYIPSKLCFSLDYRYRLVFIYIHGHFVGGHVPVVDTDTLWTCVHHSNQKCPIICYCFCLDTLGTLQKMLRTLFGLSQDMSGLLYEIVASLREVFLFM